MRMDKPEVRHESEFVPLTREQFRERFFARFYDPAFDAVAAELGHDREAQLGRGLGGRRRRGHDPLVHQRYAVAAEQLLRVVLGQRAGRRGHGR